ncbi:hypothetical protein QBC40DRAFT_276871 [Triangularia verruculosa]|uniref:Diphthamide biosynthesis protein 4 n=1 Tax=Triangularia verruculosa TaxID=2587418 RepID=A0AAN7AXN1_9PEZI|nr:hypothetical protein QBC40DRAFT_276871 [Triangularia verruculosa]
MTQQPTNHPRTHYDILSLSPTLFSSGLSPAEIKQTLKKSYRRALLSHHPDKTSSSPSTSSTSIDQITLAFTTLSTPSLRQAYDLFLSSSSSSGSGLGKHKLQTGIETIDLDDLTHQEGGGGTGQDEDGEGEEDTWSKPCRCGNPRGFLVRESDLQEAADSGVDEVVVGCADCSLWLRVVFGVVVQDDNDEEEESKRQ